MKTNIIELGDEAIAKAQQDKETFKLLYLKFVKEIYSYIFYIVGNKVQTEDIVSEAFIKAFSNIRNFKGSLKEFRAWLYRIARNTAFDYLKKEKTNVRLEQIPELPDDTYGSQEEKDALRNIWQEIFLLDNEIRDIFILKYKSDYSYKEISLITGKTEANIRQIISRTLKKLKSQNL